MRISHVPCIATLCLSVCGCQERAAQKTPSEEPRSKASPDTYFLKHDFGIVDREKRVVGKMKLKNDSDKVMVFGFNKTSCGCLSVKSMPKRIAPGETGTFEIMLDTKGQQGLFASKALFWGAEPRKLLVMASTTATVRGLTTSPQNVSLGDISTEGSVKKELLILASGYPDAKAMSARINSPCFTLISKDVATSGVVVERDVKAIACYEVIYVGKHAQTGTLTSTIVVKVKAGNADKEQTLEVPVTGYVLGNVDIVPSHVVFGPITKGPVMRTCKISFKDPKLCIDKIVCVTDHSCVTASIAEDRTSPGQWKLMAQGTIPRKVEKALLQGSIKGKDENGEIVFSVPFTALLIAK